MTELTGGGLMQTHFQSREQSRQTKLLEQVLQGIVHKKISG
jgi:hypothetical protein